MNHMSLNKKSIQPGQVAQCKTPVSAQSSERPVAPLVYRPQPVPKVLSARTFTNETQRHEFLMDPNFTWLF
jgi:hypothetical protein